MAKFEPGRSGNPGGRPKGTVTLRRYAALKTRSGRDLVDACQRILKDEETGAHVLKSGEIIDVGPTIRDKAWAIEHLTKVLRIPIAAEADGDESKGRDDDGPMTAEDLEALRAPGTVHPIKPEKKEEP